MAKKTARSKSTGSNSQQMKEPRKAEAPQKAPLVVRPSRPMLQSSHRNRKVAEA